MRGMGALESRLRRSAAAARERPAEKIRKVDSGRRRA